MLEKFIFIPKCGKISYDTTFFFEYRVSYEGRMLLFILIPVQNSGGAALEVVGFKEKIERI